MKNVVFYFLEIFLCTMFLHFVANSQNAINLKKSLSHLILNPLKALIVGNKVLDRDCRCSKEPKLLCSYP